ncbi:hypothetical protein Atai01_44570 [Amycolatopsis taiwanensis]|uniref:Transposase IS30-like HTH domain-containing protein n=1 Tax=Amycolatopsis taiwanensis TaxID=342230 RepID=A0A9W6VDX9_9PSEU|nr:hypothetical protein Atai01_44570 [Amycolatopsis taiwanensis]
MPARKLRYLRPFPHGVIGSSAVSRATENVIRGARSWLVGRGRPLELMEREVIALGIKKRMSYREIGDSIGRDHSVVFREVELDLPT